MACNAGPDIIEDGLVLCLDAGNKLSYPGTGTTWTDITGDNTGTIYNFLQNSFTEDNLGTFGFDGANDYVAISNKPSLNMTDAITISCVAYRSNWVTSGDSKLISKTENGSWQLFLNHAYFGLNNHIGALIWYAGQYRTASYSTSDLSSGWHSFDATCDGRYLIFYIDGKRVATTDAGTTGTILGTSTHLVIGAEPGGSTSVTGNYFSGKMSIVKVYNKVLSEDDIKRNHEATAGRFV